MVLLNDCHRHFLRGEKYILTTRVEYLHKCNAALDYFILCEKYAVVLCTFEMNVYLLILHEHFTLCLLHL